MCVLFDSDDSNGPERWSTQDTASSTKYNSLPLYFFWLLILSSLCRLHALAHCFSRCSFFPAFMERKKERTDRQLAKECDATRILTRVLFPAPSSLVQVERQQWTVDNMIYNGDQICRVLKLKQGLDWNVERRRKKRFICNLYSSPCKFTVIFNWRGLGA